MKLGATIALDDAKRLRLSAAPLEIKENQTEMEIAELSNRFKEAEIVAAQTNGYCNLASTDEQHRRENIQGVRNLLGKAQIAGVKSVVVGGGHRDPDCPQDVYSPHPDNWKPDALAILADSCREVLADNDFGDTKLVIETWVMTPVASALDSANLFKSVNHRNFGILFDPVNLMNLDRHFQSGEFIKEFVDTVGDAISLVHAKDTLLLGLPFTYHMSEAPIGDGRLDYPVLLNELNKLDRDLPILVEHLKEMSAYESALKYLRQLANENGIEFA